MNIFIHASHIQCKYDVQMGEGGGGRVGVGGKLLFTSET
jgi:hypothetical protein